MLADIHVAVPQAMLELDTGNFQVLMQTLSAPLCGDITTKTGYAPRPLLPPVGFL